MSTLFTLDQIELDAKSIDANSSKPVWIQVAKKGHFRGHPAGPFTLDDTVFGDIIKNFRASASRRIPIDFEHASEASATSGTLPHTGAPAQGWMIDLEQRGAGLFALVEWLPLAAKYIKSGAYKFFSPAIRFDSRDRVSGKNIGARMTSGALTNKPFLEMAAISARDHYSPVLQRRTPTPMTTSTTTKPANVNLAERVAAFKLRGHNHEQAFSLAYNETRSTTSAARPHELTLAERIAERQLANKTHEAGLSTEQIFSLAYKEVTGSPLSMSDRVQSLQLEGHNFESAFTLAIRQKNADRTLAENPLIQGQRAEVASLARSTRVLDDVTMAALVRYQREQARHRSTAPAAPALSAPTFAEIQELARKYAEDNSLTFEQACARASEELASRLADFQVAAEAEAARSTGSNAA